MPTVAFSIGGEPHELDATKAWAVVGELRGGIAGSLPAARSLAADFELRLIGATAKTIAVTADGTVALYIALKALELGL